MENSKTNYSSSWLFPMLSSAFQGDSPSITLRIFYCAGTTGECYANVMANSRAHSCNIRIFFIYISVHRWAFVFQQATLYISFHIFDAPNYPFKKIKRNEGKIIKQGKKDHGSQRARRLTKAYSRSITTFHTLGTQYFSSGFFVCFFFFVFFNFYIPYLQQLQGVS